MTNIVINEAAECLNWLNGKKGSAPSRTLDSIDSSSGAEKEVLCRLKDLAEAMDAGAEIQPEAAFKELLKGRSEYTLDSSTSVKPFKLESMSLPSSLAGCRRVEELCDDAGRRYLERRERMLRSAEEMQEHPPDKINPCVDPLLKHNRRQYLRFIHRLQEMTSSTFPNSQNIVLVPFLLARVMDRSE